MHAIDMGLGLSALDWWAEAGVDTTVDEAPRDWLARAPAPSPVSAPPPPVPAAPPLPANLPSFRRWLLADAAVPGAARARHDAAGDPASGSMVVVDMPEACDRGTGQLLTGEAGALFDRMLAAMGLTRDRIYLAPFAPARPATGKLDAAACTVLERLTRHHVALAAPRRLLLLGDAAACALLGEPVARARGRTHAVELPAGAVPAIASFHPRLVLGRPDLRKSAWSDLQMFMGLA